MNRIILFSILFLSLSAISCNDDEKLPTYKSYVSLYGSQHSDEVKFLLSRWDSVRKPTPVYTFKYDSGWLFAKGDSLEGLSTEIEREITTPVMLPHRINAANQPMWYKREINIGAPGIFFISGDDGVQLFVNNEQVKRIEENFFEADFTGEAEIVVRVLNNAMQGGLSHFAYLTKSQYETFKHDKANYIRLKHLVESAALINELTDRQLLAVNNAVDHLNDSTILSAEKLFEDRPFITGPWIVKEDDSVRILAMTDESNEVTLHYGNDSTDLSSQLVSKGNVVNFVLPVDTVAVYYRLSCKRTITPVYNFNIAESDRFTFNAWADSQSGWEAFVKNLGNVAGYNDAFGLGAGDLVNNGSDAEEWREFYNILSSSAAQRPYYLVSGNHDYDGYYDDLVPYLYRSLNLVSQPHYYSWTHSNCMFIALDPNESFPIGIPEGGKQHQWLMREVQSEKWINAKWRFIFMHQPPYSQGWEGYSGDHFLRTLLEPIIDKTPIDFVIAGHTHDYERLSKKYGNNETTYLVLGGGGGSLEPPGLSSNPEMDTVIKKHHIGHFTVSNDTIRFDAIGSDGKTMDSFTKVKRD